MGSLLIRRVEEAGRDWTVSTGLALMLWPFLARAYADAHDSLCHYWSLHSHQRNAEMCL